MELSIERKTTNARYEKIDKSGGKTMKRKHLCYTMILASMILCSCGTKEVQMSQNSQAEETVLETENETDSVEETIPYISAAESFAGGDGTKENPFQIATAEQLALLSEVNSDWSSQYNEAYYVLTSDIQLNDLSDYENWEKEAPEYQWKPVSDYFKGNFDGDGHTIRGMYVQSNRDQTSIGLFGRLRKADVSNVNLEKSCLRVNHVGINAGGIAGEILGNINVENCFTDIDIYVNDEKGTECVGGIVGWSQSGAVIKNCIFQSNIDYRDNYGDFGGIVGSASGTVVANCEARGSIIAKNVNADNLLFPHIGGIIGYSSNAVRIENCTNYMDISGTIESLGGICGVQSVGGIFTIDQNGNSIHTNGFAEIKNCKNFGNLQANTRYDEVGGMIGTFHNSDSRVDSVIIENCENYGDITGNTTTAGIIGNLASGYVQYEIKNCKNEGTITANNWCGGIIGKMGPTVDGSKISGCVNHGQVLAEAPDGGIIGGYFGFDTVLGESKRGILLVENCKNTGEVVCKSSILGTGGILGLLSPDHGGIQIRNCMNIGKISMESVGRLGGILGNVDITKKENENWIIEGCMNTGTIQYNEGKQPFTEEAKEKVFGTAKAPEDKTISVMGGSCMGGIAGQIYGGSIKNCLTTGDVLINEDYAGFIGAVCGQVFTVGINSEGKGYIFDCKYPDSYPFAAIIPLEIEGDQSVQNTYGISKEETEKLVQEYAR